MKQDNTRPTQGLSHHLRHLMLALLLPLLLTALLSTWWAASTFRDTADKRLLDTAQALARAIEDDIHYGTTILRLATHNPQTLSAFNQLTHNRIGSAEAGSQATIIQFQGDDHQALADHAIPSNFPTQQSQGTWLSNLIDSPIGPVVAMGIARETAEPAHVLLLSPSTLVGSLQKDAPELSDILVAVTDGNGRILARSRNASAYIGSPAPDWDKLQALEQSSGLFEAKTTEGGRVIFAFQSLNGTPGWVLVVGESMDVLSARWQQPLLGIILGGLLATLLGLWVAGRIVRRIQAPVQALVQHSEALTASGGEGPLQPLPRSGISELERLRTSLSSAEQALHQRAEQAHQAMETLALSERRYRTVAQAGALVFWCRDLNAELLSATGWRELTGLPEKLALGHGWLKSVHADDLPAVRIAWDESKRLNSPVDVEFRIKAANGHWRWVRARGALSDPPTEWAGVFEDVDARHQAQSRLAYMAQHDTLTGQANRLLFQEKLAAAVQQARRGQRSALLCMDLTRFKEINDTLGHPFGDTVLRALVSRLKSCIRESDLLGRLGGDEFAILQKDDRQPEASSRLACRLIEAVHLPFHINGQEVSLDLNIGIALIDNPPELAEVILKNADLALSRAKEEGRGQFRFFEPDMDIRMQQRRQLDIDLRRSLANGDFELYYQPQINLEKQTLIGFEALIRWHRPGHGLQMPASFLPLAEETGLLVPLTEWVLQQACQDAASWPEPLSVAVNISPCQLVHPNLAETVGKALRLSRLPAHRLELEITENALIENINLATSSLMQLKVAGVAITMDDFGTGYSSLGYLRAFPFDKVKIDRSFISELVSSRDSQAIVSAIVQLCRHLQIATLAEGVETQEQLQRLLELECTEGQGYLFGRPMPADELPAVIQASAQAPH